MHKPLVGEALHRLRSALVENGADAGVILMGSDTGFVGSVPQLPSDAAVVSAIRSVPCHY